MGIGNLGVLFGSGGCTAIIDGETCGQAELADVHADQDGHEYQE